MLVLKDLPVTHYLVIDNVYNENGSAFLSRNSVRYLHSAVLSNKFIESGGFTAVIQLNVGFPLL